jgi:hypothetical protein
LNPHLITAARCHDIAIIAGINPDEIAACFRCYEFFSGTAPMRLRHWWRETLLHGAIIFGLPLVLLIAIALVFVVFISRNS